MSVPSYEPRYVYSPPQPASPVTTLSTVTNGDGQYSGPVLPAHVAHHPPVRIDTFMTKEQFVRLASHMGSGNPISHFLVVHKDENGKPRFSKARSSKRAKDHASWTYDTITDKAKIKTSMGVYCKNEQNQSTWGAIDFDAHQSGQDELAKNRAIRAFTLELEYRDRYLILSASGRGYHIFSITKEPRPVQAWTKELKTVCDTIGAPVIDGECEIFPNDRTPSQETGKAIRLPGTMNPTTGEIEMILADTIMPLLDKLELEELKEKGEENSTLRSKKSLPLEDLRDREVNNSSYEHKHGMGSAGRQGQASAGRSSAGSSAGSSGEGCLRDEDTPEHRSVKEGTAVWLDGKAVRVLSLSTARLIEQVLAHHPITRKGTRHGALLRLAGDLSHKFGFEVAEKVAKEHYERYRGNVSTGKVEHMAEFRRAWKSLLKAKIKRMTAPERNCYDKAKTEAQRELIILCRSFAEFNNGDFPLPQQSTADRLSLFDNTSAKYVIDKLIDFGGLTKTAEAKRNNKAARYKWNFYEGHHLSGLAQAQPCSAARNGVGQ